jgi:hypothetical protein
MRSRTVGEIDFLRPEFNVKVDFWMRKGVCFVGFVGEVGMRLGV